MVQMWPAGFRRHDGQISIPQLDMVRMQTVGKNDAMNVGASFDGISHCFSRSGCMQDRLIEIDNQGQFSPLQQPVCRFSLESRCFLCNVIMAALVVRKIPQVSP